MLLFPVSTEVHDGRIRMAAVEIVALCIAVHLVTSLESRGLARRVNEVERQFELPGTWQPVLDSVVEQHGTGDIGEIRTLVQQRLQRSFADSVSSMRSRTILYKLGLKPASFSFINLLTYMFTHSGWMHLLGNLLFFYVCGVAMEKYWGFWRFMASYLGCGVFAGLFYVGATLLAPPEVRAAPLVGASGAIAGAMGAFLVTHAKVRVKVFYVIPLVRIGTFPVPTYIYLGFWFLGQITSTVLEPADGGGIAYAAHIGGFLLGALLGWLVKSEDDAALLVPAGVMRRIGERQTQRAVIPETLQPVAPAAGEGRLVGEGWQAWRAGDAAKASALLAHAVDNLMQAGDTRRAELADVLTRILGAVPAVPVPAAHLHQWGKHAARSGLHDLAATCFDRAAASADSPYLQKTALLAGADLRLRQGFQSDKARDDLRRLMAVDNGGLFAREAQRLLDG